MNSNSSKFQIFEKMAKNGVQATTAYRKAKEYGLSELESFEMLKQVYELSLIQIKETAVMAYNPTDSLEAHQKRLADEIIPFLDDEDN